MFLKAMHLVYRALERNPVPVSLPPEMIPPSKRKSGASLAGALAVIPGSAIPTPAAAGPVAPGAAVTVVPGTSAVQPMSAGRASPTSVSNKDYC